MRVAIDARELCGRPTGVGRYLIGLLTAWGCSDAARRHQWTLFSPEPLGAAARLDASIKVIAGSGGTAWEQVALPAALRSDRPDVFFAPGYTAPLTVGAPVVLTIHDVSFFAHPEWFSFREGVRRRLLTAWSARRARAVITDTEFSKAEITRHIGLPNSRIRVIPLGLEKRTDEANGRSDGRSDKRSGGRSDGRSDKRSDGRSDERSATVLYVGSIFERRRVDRLIESFDAVVSRVAGARLEIVGENRTRQPRLDLEALRLRSAHPDRITIRSYVDDATLARLYRDASVFVFLSEYEGFGLTPLEALAAGVPPVVLDTAVARETCNGAARYVAHDAGNQHIADAIIDLLTDAGARHSVLRHADAVLSRYDWDRAASQTLAVLEEAALGR